MIYISDLDKTLLTDTCSLSKYSRKGLNNLIEDGLNFTVASARSVISMQKILLGLNLKLPVIEFNGSFISDFNTGNHFIINNIDPNIVEELLGLTRKYDNEPFISSFDGEKDNLYYEAVNNNGMKWYLDDRIHSKDKRLKVTDNLYSHKNEKIVCFTIINKKESLMELETIIKEKYGAILEVLLIENDYSKGWHWLTLHNNKATKENGIRELLNLCNFDISELVVFGDNKNDISMFNLSPISIAVGNAVDEIKQIATEVIGSNNDDSVVKYIENDFKKK